MPDILRMAITGFTSFVKAVALTINRRVDTGIRRSHCEIEIDGTSGVSLRLEQSNMSPSSLFSSDSHSVSGWFSLIPNFLV